MSHKILPKLDYGSVAKEISRFLKQEFKKRNKDLAIVGISGGVDSNLTALLCEKAGLKLQKVFMPYGSFSDRPLGDCLERDITKAVDILAGHGTDRISKGNIMARVRMIVLYDLARRSRGLVVGTENLSEYYLGYFTLHGDQACDISPIAGLWKTQVIELAEHLSLPTPKPSAGLWEGQTDEKELGFSYKEADPILYLYCLKKLSPRKIIKDFGFKPELVSRVVEKVKATEYKRQGVPKYEINK